jgi:acetyl esterase
MGKSRRVFYALLILSIPNWVTVYASIVRPQPLFFDGAVTYIYKNIGGTELRLHAFNPPNHASSMRQPAILFFFSGGWTSGSVEQFLPQAKHFAERGMVAIVIDYRVYSRHRTTPFEAMADAKSAIRWVRSRAGELGIDPDRIAASGGSAGGHIALSAAVFGSFDEPRENHKISSKPNALVLFNPAINTSTNPAFGTRAIEGSPLQHVARDLPPTVIFQGMADTKALYADAERFCLNARAFGNRCDLHGYDGAHHGFFNPGVEGGKWYRETLLEADRFLTELGYLPKATPAGMANSAAPIQAHSRARGAIAKQHG